MSDRYSVRITGPNFVAEASGATGGGMIPRELIGLLLMEVLSMADRYVAGAMIALAEAADSSEAYFYESLHEEYPEIKAAEDAFTASASGLLDVMKAVRGKILSEDNY